MLKVTKSNISYEQKSLITRNAHVKYESPTSNGLKVMGQVKLFNNVGQRSRLRGP